MSDDKTRFAFRTVATGGLVAFALWVVGGDYSAFWVTGVSTAGVVVGVLALSTPGVLIVGLLSFALRRANRGGAWRGALPLAQGAWSALVAGVAFSSTSFALADTPGWGLALVSFGLAALVLVTAWLAEDWLTHSRYCWRSRS